MDSGFVKLTAVASPAPAPSVATLGLDPPARPAVKTYIPDAARTALAGGHGEWLAELRRVTVLINVLGLDYDHAGYPRSAATRHALDPVHPLPL